MGTATYSEKGYTKGVPNAPFYASYRLCIALVSFLVFMNMYAHRMAMSVTIVKMVNHTALRMRHDLDLPQIEAESEEGGAILYFLWKNESQPQMDNEVYSHEESIGYNEDLNVNKTDPVFDLEDIEELKRKLGTCYGIASIINRVAEDGTFVWDKVTQSHIMGAFYYGYMVSQVLGGFLAQKYSAKIVVTACLTLASLASILTPILAIRLGAISVVVLRILVGVASGATYPALLHIISQWAPPHDRTKMIGIMFAGGGLGLIVTNPVSAFLCQLHESGWALVFYTFGANSLFILPVWIFLIRDSPHEQKYCISQDEKDYITFSLKGQVSSKQGQRTPWLRMLSSGPVWAIILAMCATDWGYTMYLSYIPTYMFEVLRFDIKSNGLLSSLPFIGHWIILILCPLVTDAILSHKLLSVGNTRKLVHVIGCGGAAIFLVCLAFIDCSHAMLGVAMLTGGVTVSACVYSGFPVNIVDLSPTHSGTILGLGNTLSSIMGFSSAYVISALTTHQSQEEWQTVFFITAAIYVVGMVLYCILGRCELQPWALDSGCTNKTVYNSPIDKSLSKLSTLGLSASGVLVSSTQDGVLHRDSSQCSTTPMLMKDSDDSTTDSTEMMQVSSSNSSTDDITLEQIVVTESLLNHSELPLHETA